MKWRCFFCDFETDIHEEAAAHFGDPDDPEEFKPICKWWQRMSVEERIGEFQVLIQELNAEREENGRLLDELRKLKHET